MLTYFSVSQFLLWIFQGSSFADSFAQAVHYNFDEHINFKSFLDIILRIGELPKLDEQSKLDRVLNAIEKAAYL